MTANVPMMRALRMIQGGGLTRMEIGEVYDLFMVAHGREDIAQEAAEEVARLKVQEATTRHA